MRPSTIYQLSPALQPRSALSTMMQPPTYAQCTADSASCSVDDASESPSPPQSTPSPCASATSHSPLPSPPPFSPAHLSKVLTNSRAHARQPRSIVWSHFVKAPDYTTSKKATCVHCNKTFMSRHGSTSTMHMHLQKNHPSVLVTPDGAESPDR